MIKLILTSLYMLKYNCEHDCCQKKKYFRTQEKIKIKSEIMVKRDRNTNLVPAKTGISILILSFVYTIFFIFAYAGDSTDNGTRNYFLSLSQDLLACIFAPCIIVFQAPSIRRKINKIFTSFFD